HFGAVDWQATVWVNGTRLGEHQGGYDAFTFDITDALKGEGAQELVVGVWDPTNAGTQPRGKQVVKPGGIYYTPTTGIWQTVWLEPVPAVRIAGGKIVPDVPGGQAVVTAPAEGGGGRPPVRLTCLDGTRPVADVTGEAGRPVELPIAPVQLWSPESPFLYDLRVELLQDGRPLDRVESYFGMRRIAVGPDE